MTDNDVRTRPVPHQSATVQSDPFPPAAAPAEEGTNTGVQAPPVASSYQVVGGVPHDPQAAGFGSDSTRSSDGSNSSDGGRRRTVMDRVRTPIAAAVGGGILVLGVGFGAGFAVGHGTAGGAASTVQNGPGGQGAGGFGGGMGGGPGGLGQTGQGQTGQGQTGQGQTVPGQTGQDQSGSGAGTTDSQTGTGASTDTSFAA